MVPARTFCAPIECCVQPSAYRMVIALSLPAVDAIMSQIWRMLSAGVPQMRSTISTV